MLLIQLPFVWRELHNLKIIHNLTVAFIQKLAKAWDKTIHPYANATAVWKAK